MSTISRYKDYIFYTFVILIYFALLTFVARNLQNDYLWYDEAGQFFISKGLNHWSDPNATDGSIADVIWNNARYNQDPGGYGLTLYLWLKISTNIVWIRLLSFIFFVGAIAFTCLATKEITSNNKLAVVSGLIIFTLWGGVQAYELRAYSMELCGVAYGIWMLFYLWKHNKPIPVLLCSLGLCYFVTARYTMLIFGFVYTISAFVILWKKGADIKTKCLSCAIFGIPLLATAIAVYGLAMKIQNSGLQPMNYVEYLPTLAYIISYLTIIAVMFLTWKYQNSHTRFLIMLFAVITLIFIGLGAAKLLPWGLEGNKGGPFLWMLYFVLLICVSSLFRKSNYYKIAGYGALCILCAMICQRVVVHGTANISHHKTETLADVLRSLDYGMADTLYVSRGAGPELRYLFEYGALKDRAAKVGYPAKFVFLKGQFHCMGNNRSKTDKQIHGEFLGKLPVGSVLIRGIISNDTLPPDYNKLTEHVYQKQL